METSTEKNDICCQEFDPAPWDDKIIEWNNKPFIKDKVCTLFYMPVNFGRAMVRLDKLTTSAGVPITDNVCLSDHTSPWNMDLYLAVDKAIAGANNVAISGRFYCKVFEGSYSETGKWSKSFAALLESRNLRMKKMYTWYTTCPKCAKKYGKNYVVLLGEIAE